MTNYYDRQIPIDTLLGASMFNSRQPEEHFLACELLGMLMVSLPLSGDADDVAGPLEPPAKLISQIFPWVEAERAALEKCEHRLGHPAQDIALRQFLHLLVWLHHVLLQDVAMLFSQNPSCPVFQFSLFCSTSF
jgi:Centromere DNA-binding protein complex CBF3 subunit, domain 2